MSWINYTKNLVKNYGVPVVSGIFMGSSVWNACYQNLENSSSFEETLIYGGTFMATTAGFLLGRVLSNCPLNVSESVRETKGDVERVLEGIVFDAEDVMLMEAATSLLEDVNKHKRE